MQSQTLFGATFKGGNDDGGTIGKFSPASNNLTVVQSFESPATNPNYTNLIQAGDGKLYGMTAYGGSDDDGVIFSYDPSAATYKKLIDFDFINGGYPLGSLLQANNGKLYGLTSMGGKSRVGVIFSYDIFSGTYQKLMDFDITNGASPSGSLIQAKDGKLYGLTSKGGSNDAGVIFSFNPGSLTYTKLKDLDYANGAVPYGSLMQAVDGKLYGLTSKGGSKRVGVIFSYDPSSSAYKKLEDFDNNNGATPNGSLIQATNGKLYGTAANGGSKNVGVIFSFDPSSSAYKKLKDFDYTNGGYPKGSLAQASNGKLYGVTSGGLKSVGVLFLFDPSSLVYSKLKRFDNINGSNPGGADLNGSLLQAGDGKLYGLASEGGNSGRGTIFSYDPVAEMYQKLKDFGSDKNGNNVPAALVKASDGKLYGITTNGGARGVGVIFSYDPLQAAYKKVSDFDCTTGCKPRGSLLQAGNGKLYGTTSSGGNNDFGVIFSFDPASATYTKLKDFDDGIYPYGSLVQAGDGKLYGMTGNGGSKGNGVIFSFDPASSTYKKLKDFDYINGGFPSGSLVVAGNGKLYGMTAYGGSTGNGVIFSFDPTSLTYKKLVDFNNTNGGNPIGSSFIQAGNGRLYGTTFYGGQGNGVIFSFDPASSIYTKLKDFVDSGEGVNPLGSLKQASDGKLYGVTKYGGKNGVGVIFSFDIASSAYTKLKDYDGANGANPDLGSAFIEVGDSGVNIAPDISITSPAKDTNLIAPGSILLSADASDPDGTIRSVDFYSDSTLLFTEHKVPYSRLWDSIPAGSYHIIAVATDNNGLKTTSSPVHITVLHKRPPVITITSPADRTVYSTPANIVLSAEALAHGGKIQSVKFFNGTTLIHTEKNEPYTWIWKNVPAGNYIITAQATDSYERSIISAPVAVIVNPPAVPLLSKRPFAINGITDKMVSENAEITPNPAYNILNISTTGLQKDKPLVITLITSSGIVIKNMQTGGSFQTIKLNILSLASGVYILKIVNSGKVIYKQFVKI